MDKNVNSSDHKRLELGSALRSRRRKRGLSLRDVEAESGVSFNTLSRIERGFVPDLRNYERVVHWLGLPSGAFLGGVDERASANTPTVIARHLFADRHLSADDAGAIAELVKDLYEQLAVESPALTVHLRSSQTFRKDAGNLLAGILYDMQQALENEP